jgi:hypothetical protein
MRVITTVIINPAISRKNIILETRHPALAAPLKPKMPATMENTRNVTARIIKYVNIMV